MTLYSMAKLSVALCTFNGAKHLLAQLTSIAEQTRRPDELVICDDGSRDETHAILESFARSASFLVRVHKNAVNLGSTKNFEKAIGLCEGDVIALADQDDVWPVTKLDRFMNIFVTRPEVGLVFSDGELVDDSLRPTGRRIWANLPFTQAMQREFERGQGAEALLRYNVVTGAACAFRANLRQHLLPIPENWIHDYWIACLAAGLTEVVPIAEPLLLYRQHATQQIGVNPLTLFTQMRAALKMDVGYFEKRESCFRALLTRLDTIRDSLKSSGLLGAVQGKVDHSQAQVRIHRSSRLVRPFLALRELLTGHYHRFGRGLKSFAVDAAL